MSRFNSNYLPKVFITNLSIVWISLAFKFMERGRQQTLYSITLITCQLKYTIRILRIGSILLIPRQNQMCFHKWIFHFFYFLVPRPRDLNKLWFYHTHYLWRLSVLMLRYVGSWTVQHHLSSHTFKIKSTTHVKFWKSLKDFYWPNNWAYVVFHQSVILNFLNFSIAFQIIELYYSQSLQHTSVTDYLEKLWQDHDPFLKYLPKWH